ncbi:guanylate kinase [Micromonospora sp. NBC_01796]|nr:guanylate kinase [Micromonospora sp. NBC_01796]WSA86110.1 guanylate kinase [Micromonospora sp. NBC_01796]
MSTVDDARPAARLTLLAGPAGAGKESVIELIRARSPVLWVSVPMTTRSRCPYEADGTRLFVDRDEFEALIAADELIEWDRYAGHLHGTPRQPVQTRLRAAQPVLLSLDLPGARRVRAAMPGSRLVYLVPPGVVPPAAQPHDGAEIDRVVVNDFVERAAEELVGLLGSSFLTPAQPRTSG